MSTTKHPIVLILIMLGILINSSVSSSAQDNKLAYSIPEGGNIYVNANTGNNANSGILTSPLKTLNETAKRINSAKGKGPISVFISKGIYALEETADFNPVDWEFSKENRLTIRAEVLPDDSNWNPGDMPVILSTMPFSVEKNDSNKITGGQNFGIMIQESHVTIQGLRILGEPVHENPYPGILIRNYPIIWEGKNLEDLRVTQCLFIGNKYAMANHLGVLANGSGLEVDHCLFYGVKDAVVMWNSPAAKSSFHHNLIVDSYGGIVWTWSATDDFKFYNNVVSNANVLWMLDKEEKLSYSIDNSVIVGYNSLVNKGGGAHGFGEKANQSKITINKNVTLRKDGRLEIVEDLTSKRFLHIKPGTLGADLRAGLFTK
ncbi:hypothetical protein MD537_09765 [Flavihumibacter sediminis]|jgi:hypothetical protein|nr:hypothetical protein [Flavihumibacter sediminis]